MVIQKLKSIASNLYRGGNIVFSPKGEFLVHGGLSPDSICLWDVKTGELIQTLCGHEKLIHCLDFSSDGKLFASAGNDSVIKLWYVPTRENFQTLTFHKGIVSTVLFCPKRPLLASASFKEGIVRLWNNQTGEIVQEFEYGFTRFAPSGDAIAIGKHNAITEYSVETGTPLAVIEVETEGIPEIVYSPDGNFLVFTSKGEYLGVWDVHKKRVINTIGKLGDGIVNTVFSPDGRFLAGSSVYETSIKLWDFMTGESLHTIYGRFDEITALSFNPDGSMLAIGIGGRFGYNIELWSISQER
ncbi:MAG: WD40 repeat domain-containing protein [Anaerolineae bacterium]|nr:WD40 repeat domain-containing protein [Anaerolineae bacterium]